VLTWNHTVVHAGDRRADGAVSVGRRSVVSAIATEGGAIVRVASKLAARINGRFISSLYCRRLSLVDENVGVRTAIQHMTYIIPHHWVLVAII